MGNKTYHIDIKDNVLTFSTSSFKAEKGSVLHSGIYNRELASSLASGALVMLLGFFFASKFKTTAVFFIVTLLFFIISFVIFRTYIFLEPILYIIIDKTKGDIAIVIRRIFRKRSITSSLSELNDIRQDYLSVTPENPDGIRLVEQVALQHGTVIPGFGQTSEFYTVELEFKDAKRFIIFSSEDHSIAEDIATKFKNFIKG
ncbi:hypothetical protein JZK55_11090 [Dissulfurispira thermophila]|uniref:Uncharacterized protein n=2 Tax=root TaxID=1 RepID=A0A7G1H389_9BACT|nr:hypothetical protein [Dissulfurispira thermophila]BCB96187.1 hypothetical protein JZK55_11090 [Dissulfurispira thermophila]